VGQTCCLMIVHLVVVGFWASMGFSKMICRVVFRTTNEWAVAFTWGALMLTVLLGGFYAICKEDGDMRPWHEFWNMVTFGVVYSEAVNRPEQEPASEGDRSTDDQVERPPAAPPRGVSIGAISIARGSSLTTSSTSLASPVGDPPTRPRAGAWAVTRS